MTQEIKKMWCCISNLSGGYITSTLADSETESRRLYDENINKSSTPPKCKQVIITIQEFSQNQNY